MPVFTPFATEGRRTEAEAREDLAAQQASYRAAMQQAQISARQREAESQQARQREASEGRWGAQLSIEEERSRSTAERQAARFAHEQAQAGESWRRGQPDRDRRRQAEDRAQRMEELQFFINSRGYEQTADGGWRLNAEGELADAELKANAEAERQDELYDRVYRMAYGDPALGIPPNPERARHMWERGQARFGRQGMFGGEAPAGPAAGGAVERAIGEGEAGGGIQLGGEIPGAAPPGVGGLEALDRQYIEEIDDLRVEQDRIVDIAATAGRHMTDEEGQAYRALKQQIDGLEEQREKLRARAFGQTGGQPPPPPDVRTVEEMQRVEEESEGAITEAERAAFQERLDSIGRRIDALAREDEEDLARVREMREGLEGQPDPVGAAGRRGQQERAPADFTRGIENIMGSSWDFDNTQSALTFDGQFEIWAERVVGGNANMTDEQIMDAVDDAMSANSAQLQTLIANADIHEGGDIVVRIFGGITQTEMTEKMWNFLRERLRAVVEQERAEAGGPNWRSAPLNPAGMAGWQKRLGQLF